MWLAYYVKEMCINGILWFWAFMIMYNIWNINIWYVIFNKIHNLYEFFFLEENWIFYDCFATLHKHFHWHLGQSEFILFEHFLFQILTRNQQFIIIMSEIHRYFWPFLLNMFLGNYDLKGKIKTL